MLVVAVNQEQGGLLDLCGAHGLCNITIVMLKVMLTDGVRGENQAKTHIFSTPQETEGTTALWAIHLLWSLNMDALLLLNFKPLLQGQGYNTRCEQLRRSSASMFKTIESF